MLNIANEVIVDGRGAILITSRHESTQELGLLIKLTPLSEDEALELLFWKSNQRRTQESFEEGLKIVRNLGCLALAIHQAAAYIQSTSLSLSQFSEKYEDQKKKILNYIPTLWKYSKTEEDSEIRKSVFTTWEMSFQQIAPAARRKKVEHFLTLSAFLNPASVREDLFACSQENTASLLEWTWMFGLGLIMRNSDGGISDREIFDKEIPVAQTPVEVSWNSGIYEKLINELRGLSLLENTSCDSDETQVFSLHCLIRDWLQLRVDAKQQQDYTREAVKLVTAYLDSSVASAATLQRKQEVLAHMDACLSNNYRFLSEPGSGIGSISLKHPTSAFGIFYLRQGRYQIAETLFSRLLEDDEKHLGPVHPDTLVALENLATVYRHQSRYKEAEAYFERVLASREKEPGPEHPDTLQTIHDLANIYHISGLYPEGETLYKRALAGREKVLGLEHPRTLATANNLAILYRLMGRYVESIELYKWVLASREKQLGLDHTETLSTIQGLAIVYRLHGQYDEAEFLQNRALEARERVLGPEHPDTLMTVDNLACVYREKGCYDEAAELFERVWEGREKNLGPDHSSTLGTINGLAIVRRYQGRYEEAERLHSLVLESRKKCLGHKHPKTLRTMDGLATVYQLQGRYGEAEALFEQTLAGRQEKLGSEHPDTRQTAEHIKNLKRTLSSPSLASIKKVRSE
jgi:tetratricopeptide (TPR) repeat protein